MSKFQDIFLKLLSEDNTAAGAFGPAATGSTGNAFPGQTDAGYAPGDARMPSYLGARKVKSKKGKKTKIPLQRRPFVGI